MLANGVRTDWGYDAAGRPRALEHRVDGAGQFLARYEYLHDPAGRRTWQRSIHVGRSLVDQAFEYDDAGRLRRETAGGAEQAAYGYDAAGNRASRTAGGVTTTYAYDPDNRLTSAAVAGGPTDEYFYDANGSLTRAYASGTGTWTDYGWDAAGRLARVQGAAART